MTRKQLLYLWQYLYAGSGGAIVDGLVLRPNFNDMANLSLTSPSNGSAVFNGSSDYVGTTLTPAAFPSGPFTLSAWVNTNDNLDFRSIAGADTAQAGVSGAFYFQIRNTGQFAIVLLNAFSTQITAATGEVAQVGRWYYVTGVFDGSTLQIYVDGSLKGTTAWSGTRATLNTNVIIGSAYFNNAIVDFWDGNLANVAVWNRVLTSDEINSIMWKRYDLLTAGESTGLVAWYALDDITGTSVPDSTGTYNATAY